ATDSKEQANLWSELGDICQNAHRVDQAYKAYRESLKIDDDNWITLNNLAYLLADQMGEHRRAQALAGCWTPSQPSPRFPPYRQAQAKSRGGVPAGSRSEGHIAL
ncbi:MAG: tetratricopeptide repeat protein, partial [Chloroflexi bacterium]|nr:tetratricopeptide repeat protein [Chloroflexota bacterium]